MNENEPIATIVDDIEMNIQTGPFNNGEYENVRKQIKEKKHLALLALLLKY